MKKFVGEKLGWSYLNYILRGYITIPFLKYLDF